LNWRWYERFVCILRRPGKEESDWYLDDEDEDETEHGAGEHDVLRRLVKDAEHDAHGGGEND
jgi:hypothetical protein